VREVSHEQGERLSDRLRRLEKEAEKSHGCGRRDEMGKGEENKGVSQKKENGSLTLLESRRREDKGNQSSKKKDGASRSSWVGVVLKDKRNNLGKGCEKKELGGPSWGQKQER